MRVALEELDFGHERALAKVCRECELWKIPFTFVPDPDEVRSYIDQAVQSRSRRLAYAYVIRVKNPDRVVGTTRFQEIDLRHRRLQIGSTWICPSWQGTFVNSESKYLMLRFAFEALQLLRVEFITDVLNERSRRALVNLGAREEGILRKHMVMKDGRVRDSAVFSITDAEWPECKAHLWKRIKRRHDFVWREATPA